MAKENYYEISARTDFEFAITPVEPENAMGVFFTSAEIYEKYGVTLWHGAHVVANDPVIITTISEQLKKVTEVPYEALGELMVSNKEYEQHGFKYSAARKVFYRAKVKVKTTTLTKKHKWQLVRDMHYRAERWIDFKYQLYSVALKTEGMYNRLANVILMAKNLGAVLDDHNNFLDARDFNYSTNVYTCKPRTLAECIASANQYNIPQELHAEAEAWVREWWDSITEVQNHMTKFPE